MPNYRLELNDAGEMVYIREDSMSELKSVADVCKSLHNENITGSREMRHLAEFPGALIEQYCVTNGVEWNEWFQNPVHCQRMLNDPDLAHFRIDASRVVERGE